MLGNPLITPRRALGEAERERVEKYWLFDIDQNQNVLFKYSEDQLDLERPPSSFKIKTLIEGRSAGAPCTVPGLTPTCIDCGDSAVFRNRDDLRKLILLKHIRCRNCLTLFREKQVGDARAKLDQYLESVTRTAGYYQSLTFVEKLFLYLLTHYARAERGMYLVGEFSSGEIMGSPHYDSELFASLLSKGALVDVTELPPKIKEAEEFLDSYWFIRGSSNGIPKGTYIAVETSLKEMREKLLRDIFAMNLCIHDVDVLKSVVLEGKIHALRQGLAGAARKYQVKVEDSQRLLSLLTLMAKEYYYLDCLRLFYRYSKDVCAKLKTGDIPWYKENKMVCQLITLFITHLRHTGKPMESGSQWNVYNSSDLEAFIAPNFMEGHLNWECLTFKQIVADWIGRHAVIEESVA